MSFFLQSQRKTGFEATTTPSPGRIEYIQASMRQDPWTILEDLLSPLLVPLSHWTVLPKLTKRRSRILNARIKIFRRCFMSMIWTSKLKRRNKFHRCSDRERKGLTWHLWSSSRVQGSITLMHKYREKQRYFRKLSMFISSCCQANRQSLRFLLTTWVSKRTITMRWRRCSHRKLLIFIQDHTISVEL